MTFEIFEFFATLVRKFWGSILTFVKVTGGEKLVEGLFAPSPSPILKKVNDFILVSLLLTLNKFYMWFFCFNRWL